MIQFSSFLLHLVDVAIEILKYKVELVIFFDELQQLHNVGMMQFAQNAHLIEGSALIPISVLLLHLFNCD